MTLQVTKFSASRNLNNRSITTIMGPWFRGNLPGLDSSNRHLSNKCGTPILTTHLSFELFNLSPLTAFVERPLNDGIVVCLSLGEGRTSYSSGASLPHA